MAVVWRKGVAGARMFDELRTDPKVCGVAMFDLPYHRAPGLNRLRPGIPLYLPYADHSLGARADHAPAYNRILDWADTPVPAGYSPIRCIDGVDGRLCLFARPGGCDPTAARAIGVNAVLERLGH
jgi:GPI mannosyltransferase 3